MGRRTHVAALAACSLALAWMTVPGPASAEPSTSSEAMEEMEALGGELRGLESQLDEDGERMESTDYEMAGQRESVDRQSERLREMRDELSEIVRGDYKTGTVGILSIIFDSSSVEEATDRIHYVRRQQERQSEAVAEIEAAQGALDEAKGQLEAQKSRQEELVRSTQAKVDEYRQRVAQAKATYERLREDERRELERQAEERRERERRSAAAVAYEAATEPEPSSPSPGSAQAGQGVETALSRIGCPYVYGATGPDCFDCSGLVYYSYGPKRGRGTYDMIASLKSTGDWHTSMDELAYGDLVFPHSGHVGIYLGDGMMLHSPRPGRTVCIAPVYSFLGGGPY